MSTPSALPTTVDAVIGRLADAGYLADRRLGTAVFLALTLRRPLFLEGEPGVGKTELAKALASVLEATLLRVQCYEGLDIAQTAYEWNVARQMMEIRLAEAAHGVADPAARERLGKSLYSREMLIERPLLEALTQERSPVLLIDELDRADEPFDAFLLEVLAENQLTIPELGTIKASAPPIVDHHQQPHPRDPRRPEAALPLPLGRLPGRGARARDRPPARAGRGGAALRRDRRLRPADAHRRPVQVAGHRRDDRLDQRAGRARTPSASIPENVQDTLGVLLKHRDDITKMSSAEVTRLLNELRETGRAGVR